MGSSRTFADDSSSSEKKITSLACVPPMSRPMHVFTLSNTSGARSGVGGGVMWWRTIAGAIDAPLVGSSKAMERARRRPWPLRWLRCLARSSSPASPTVPARSRVPGQWRAGADDGAGAAAATPLACRGLRQAPSLSRARSQFTVRPTARAAASVLST